MSSARRHNVRIDLATNDIIEQIADERGPDGEDILARIQSLPPDLSAVLSLRCLSGLTSLQQIDEKLDARIASRLSAMECFTLTFPDYRKKGRV